MLSPDTVLISIGLALGGGMVLLWHHAGEELRRDWQDLRRATTRARATRRVREGLAHGRSCGQCGRPLKAAQFHRTVRFVVSESAAPSWVYRCECGGSTAFDSAGHEMSTTVP